MLNQDLQSLADRWRALAAEYRESAKQDISDEQRLDLLTTALRFARLARQTEWMIVDRDVPQAKVVAVVLTDDPKPRVRKLKKASSISLPKPSRSPRTSAQA